ncbi:hypothetical protein C474_01367 [Halogeometricum pallidum JCM 14848]|uniref:DUF8101 domain-containing protein n=1 Tax=Halogeometricum pallidum JCM 14848 TaxID=1227487 RepID=M0DJI5_HALPD|nr:hypothetical protein [Halogeometricum pallidum]ELZ34968.1 hypothetical protein C474_01367 [Halogeometricum pallidum JCM 14848]
MSDELPDDARENLSDLLDRGSDAARLRDERAVEGVVDSVETLAHHDVADEETRAVLLHGCRRIAATRESEPLVAAAYFEAMRRVVDGE